MNFFQVKSVNGENISLDKRLKVVNNDDTTKLLSVKPNRHSLAIFVPSFSTGAKHCHNLNLSGLTAYDGLIRPNTRPVLGNKSSRIVAVVESRCPMLATILTKLLGVCLMQAKPSMLNLFQRHHENISLDKSVKIENNLILSQKLTAVMPNGLNWLFYCPKTGQSHPIYKIRLWVLHHLMVWLILQNKPIGKYAKRLLLIPRVRPHRPNLGYQLNKLTGVFQ